MFPMRRMAVWMCGCSARRIVYVTIAALVVILIFMASRSILTGNRYLQDPGVRETGFTGFTVGNASTNQACVQAQFEMYPNKKFRDFFADAKKSACPGKDWVKIEAGVFRILEFARKKHGKITCDYLPILRGEDDFHYHEGEVIRNIHDGAQVTSDVSKVSCSAQGFFAAKYSNYHATIPYVDSIHRRAEVAELPEEALGLSVLMFGFDSVSRLTWQRKLPKSYAYMRDVLKSIVLAGYNIVGDGTPAAYLPILTGRTEGELPAVERGDVEAKPVNRLPFVWDEFKRAGYVTHYTEDSSAVGTFTYRMVGFKKQPTDHYLRHFYSELEKQKVGICLGSEYKHNVMFNFLTDFENMYKNKRTFSFGFQGDLSHDSNTHLNIADDDLKQWLEALHDGGLLNNTMLLLLSDHGARFQHLRETVQGRMEERNPFVSIRVPPWFQSKYPGAYRNLVKNSKRLTTPFDIHATFRDILFFRNESRGNISNRGISLFSEVPAERTCAHAGITPHWCNCLGWTPVKKDSLEAVKAAEAFLDLVNSLTDHVRHVCSVLQIDTVLEVKVLTASSKLLKHKSVDQNGNIADTKLFQLVVHTKPGGGHFEATVVHHVHKGTFVGKLKDISRTNAYGKSSVCVARTFPHLLRFCCCKNDKVS